MTTNQKSTSTQPRVLGLSSLHEYEREVLSWNREKRLEEFQKVNPGVDPYVLVTKLLYIETLTLENGEILDTLRLNPKLSWEKVRDILFSGLVDGYTSTYHGLKDIEYPEHFWKATIENQREMLRLS